MRKTIAQEAELKAAQAALAIAEEKAYTARNDGFADGVSAQQEFEEKREAAANTVTGFFYVLNHKDDSDGLGVCPRIPFCPAEFA